MEQKNPPAMNIRQNIQEFMTESLNEKEFNPDDIDLVQVNIRLARLGFAFHNFKIINLSDIHLGQWINPEYLSNIVEYVNSLKPDIITLTGDYVSYIIDGYEDDLIHSFSKLKSSNGKFGILGNHDHWMGEDKIRNIFKKSDIVDLSNDVCTLKKDGEILNICGVDSCTVKKDDIKRVCEKLPSGGVNILLAHEPDFASISSKTGLFDLQISGHSHGGQLIIPGIKTTPFRGNNSRKYPVGMYKVGDMIQYTSKGLGTNSFRMRINCNPEITMIVLKTIKRIKIAVLDEK